MTSFQSFRHPYPTSSKFDQRVAYFCMEFGIDQALKIYSGGLGYLAGSHMRSAYQLKQPLIGIGILWKYGYYDQVRKQDQSMDVLFMERHYNFLEETGITLTIHVHNNPVKVKVYYLPPQRFGTAPIFLLSTDIPENDYLSQKISHHLYDSNTSAKMAQHILLGAGGMALLDALDYQADIHHFNEAHPLPGAFKLYEKYRDLDEVKKRLVFTTHTPVPAGHDYFHEHLLQQYLYPYAESLGISWEQFVALGKINPGDHNELFSMSHLAMRLSQEVNGVSRLHGAVSQKMFNVLYPGYIPEELHIGYVTNSVHYPTWIAHEWNELYNKTFGKGFLRDQSNKEYWRKIHQVSDEEIMSIRQLQKKRLLDYIKSTLQEDLTRRGENPRNIFEVINAIENDALILGFARRFATYKRAHLLFTNMERLNEIVNEEGRPVLFLFAGKAHPADQGGQDLIKHIIHVSKRPEFIGKVIFLENYNMEMAKLLVRGVDIWLNTPTRPKEASGTSGMKAALNGVMNFSVLDGWWAEGYRPDAGWALSEERTYDDQSLQNELDAETIYNILEHEIVPAYFDRNEQGVSPKWAGYIKNIIAEVAPVFTMKRMLDDYYERFYNKLYERGRAIKAKQFKLASQMAAWKAQMEQRWNEIEVVEANIFDSDNFALPVGQPFKATIQLHIDGIDAKHVGVEVAFFKRINEEEVELQVKEELKLKGVKGHVATYSCQVDPELAGVYEYGFRVYPKHEMLAHRQDLALVHWI